LINQQEATLRFDAVAFCDRMVAKHREPVTNRDRISSSTSAILSRNRKSSGNFEALRLTCSFSRRAGTP